MSKKYVVVSNLSGNEIAFVFGSHDDAVDYINETTSSIDQNVIEIKETTTDHWRIMLHNNVSFTMSIKEIDESKIKFHLVKYKNDKYVETRRFSTRENAIKYVEKEFDKYDFDADEDETEAGDWHLIDEDENLNIKFVLLIAVLEGKFGSTYHEILGVKRNATKEEIKTAYRQKSKEHHPDLGGNEKTFRKVNEAYNKLISDEIKSGEDDFTDAYPCANVEYTLRNAFEKANNLEGEAYELLIEEARKVAIKKICIGAAWAIGGGIVTAATYSAASDGGTYMIFWGAIIFGIWDILKGLYWLANPKSLVRKALNNMQDNSQKVL
jgi:hypothetical protein